MVLQTPYVVKLASLRRPIHVSVVSATAAEKAKKQTLTAKKTPTPVKRAYNITMDSIRMIYSVVNALITKQAIAGVLGLVSSHRANTLCNSIVR